MKGGAVLCLAGVALTGFTVSWQNRQNLVDTGNAGLSAAHTMTKLAVLGPATASTAVEQRWWQRSFNKGTETPSMHQPLPIDKLSCKLQGRPCDSTSYSPVVLVSCGSFNPPTNMHLRMFDLAEHALLQSGTDVLGGYLSPVNDAYKKPGLLPAEQRVAMCELAAGATDDVMVDSWEAQQKHYQRSLTVLEHVESELNAQLHQSSTPQGSLPHQSGRPGVWKEDHLHQILGTHGVVCVTRHSADVHRLLANEGTIIHKYRHNIVVVEEPIVNDMSSTNIRQQLAQGRPVRYLIPDGVLRYIQQHHLYSSA
ncbi:hypothetical protein WJX72_003627 [[Myrmecia] bisecta]|uniref:Nicotinamide-nucleotide adenylyltransferase n=1 Tax=[Myrmecia] bisecta TaxID=41462 RepID=A0AAW1R5L1_9CHLO